MINFSTLCFYGNNLKPHFKETSFSFPEKKKDNWALAFFPRWTDRGRHNRFLSHNFSSNSLLPPKHTTARSNETKQQTVRCSLRSITDACGVKRSQQYLNLVKRSACRSLFCAKCPSSRFGSAKEKRERKRANDAQADSDEAWANREKEREPGCERARFLGCYRGSGALYEFYTPIIMWLL